MAHVHLHVLARYAEDGVLRVYRDRPHYPAPDELDDLAERVRQALSPGSSTARA